MSSLNKIILVGTVANDPSAKETTAGDAVSRFILTTERPASGDAPAHSDDLPVVAWRQTAEKAETLTKGQMVIVEGRIVTRTYEDNGVKKYATEVEARELRALDGSAPAAAAASPKRSLEPKRDAKPVAESDFDWAGSANEEDIPF